MVTTELRNLLQLQKDRPLKFLLNMLVLLMSIHVLYGCHCEEVDWERVMCPGENKAVILGNTIVESRVFPPGASEVTWVHIVQVQTIFKQGLFNLTMLSTRNIIMLTPNNCNHVQRNTTAMYMISGDTDAGGVLNSSNCTIAPLDGFVQKSGRENLTNIYWGDAKPKC